MIAAAALLRCGFCVLDPLWNDDEQDLIVLWNSTSDIPLPTQVKAFQGADGEVSGLKKKYLERNKDLSLFAFSLDHDLAWFIPGSDTVISYHASWVARSNSAPRRGRPAGLYEDIDVDKGEVPIRFCTTIGDDVESDSWLIDTRRASLFSSKVKNLADKIQERRDRTWSGSEPQIPEIGPKPIHSAVQNQNASRSGGRLYALRPEWAWQNARVAVASALSRGGVRVAQPFVPVPDADLFIMHYEDQELLPIRLYVRPAQSETSATSCEIDVSTELALPNQDFCMAVYSSVTDRLWLFPSARSVSEAASNGRVQIDLSTNGNSAFDSMWLISSPRQLQEWVLRIGQRMVAQKKQVFFMSKAFTQPE